MTDAASSQPAFTQTVPGPLSGVRVLDLSRVLAGPWATQMLADLGAEVIKVERPGCGDDTRAWGPPFAQGAEAGQGDAAYFLCANRNKRSVTVDIAEAEGAALVRRLAAQSDVVVENFKAGGLARYGLDHATLAVDNPRLVYCSITGFGQTGPDAGRAGYDYMIQGMAGLMSITGQPDGAPGAEPMKVGVAVVDLFTGTYACAAILAALMHARATGEGQHIDMALFDVGVAMLANQASNYFATGEPPGRLGNAHPNLAPYQVFATADGAVVLAVGNDGQFRAAARGMGAETLADDPRFAANAGRVTHRAALVEAMAPLMAARTSDHWLAAFEAAGVPCGPINDLERVFAEPQAVARGLVVEQARVDLAAPVKSLASPLRLGRTPPAYVTPPPVLGEGTRALLGERLGLTSAELDALAARGVI